MKKFEEHFNQEAIISSQRALRPIIKKEDVTCPFCPKNEKSLDQIIMEKWHGNMMCAKIVNNKYPITNSNETRGFHDVVIDTLNHNEKARDFSIVHWEILLLAIKERWLLLMKLPNICFIQVFKNDGEDAGASIAHSHWQILALEEVPKKMQWHYQYYNQGDPHKACYLCSIEDEGFLVFENENWRVWIPPSPEFDGEVWLVPKIHRQHFGQLTTMEIKNLGKLIKYLLLAYEKIKPDTAYNICFMSGDVKGTWPYHFYVKMIRRKGRIAGFEIATGCHIITQRPETYGSEIKNILKGMYQ